MENILKKTMKKSNRGSESRGKHGDRITRFPTKKKEAAIIGRQNARRRKAVLLNKNKKERSQPECWAGCEKDIWGGDRQILSRPVGAEEHSHLREGGELPTVSGKDKPWPGSGKTKKNKKKEKRGNRNGARGASKLKRKKSKVA